MDEREEAAEMINAILDAYIKGRREERKHEKLSGMFHTEQAQKHGLRNVYLARSIRVLAEKL